MSLLLCATAVSAYTLSPSALQTRVPQTVRRVSAAPVLALDIDLKGKTVFVAGVADSTGYGWAICKVNRPQAPRGAERCAGRCRRAAGLAWPKHSRASRFIQLGGTWRRGAPMAARSIRTVHHCASFRASQLPAASAAPNARRRSPTPAPPSPSARGRRCWASSRSRSRRASSTTT